MKRIIVPLFIMHMALLFAAGHTPQEPRPGMIILYMPVHRSVGQLRLDRVGQLHGVRLHLLLALNRDLKPMGIQLRYRITRQGELPIGRCIDELTQNRYQAYLGLGISPERQKRGIRYSHIPLYTVPNVLWMLKKHAFPYKDLSSLKGKRIGVVRGKPVLMQPGIDKKILIDRSAPTPASNVQKLLRGRIDAIVDPLSSTGTVVLEMGIENQIEFCLACLPVSRAYIGYSPAVPESVRIQIDRVVETLSMSGEIQNIMFGRLLNRLKQGLINGKK